MRIEKLVRPNILSLSPYTSARGTYYSSDGILLDANELPYGNELNRYPDPQQRTLKQVIATEKKVRVENIMIGNGSDEILDLLIRIFCRPGIDEIITLPPTYGMYKVIADINDVGNRKIPLATNLELPVSRILEKASERSKILFICSPNNPTGHTFSIDDIKSVLDRFNGIVVIDEAYIDFSPEESLTSLINRYPNLIICQTLSKAYGMAGIRIGIGFASTEIVDLFNRIKPPYNVNRMSQEQALSALKNVDFEEQVLSITEQKEMFEKELLKLDMVVQIFPSDANFLLVRFRSALPVYQFLRENNVIVRDRSSQHLCNECLRITIGNKDEMRSLITLLNRYEEEN